MSPRVPLRRTVLLACGGLVLSLLAAPTAASARPTTATARTPAQQVDAAPVPRLVWTRCGPRGFQCATARVPLDYDAPHGVTITLALTRRRATDPAHRIGTIMFDPGGPGSSGVDFLQAVGPELYSPAVRAHFDYVGFDPRGVGRSTPLRCFATTQQAVKALPPFPFPYTPTQERIWHASDIRLAQACLRRAGAILDHMSTANVARDTDLLRRAFGERLTTYVGYSYGTYIGSTYANMFPDRVRAMVIDGVIDPVSDATGRGDQWKTQPVDFRLHSEQGALKTLQGFFQLCDRHPHNCAFSAGNPAVRYAKIAQRLKVSPVRLPDGNGGTTEFGYTQLVGTTLGAMFDPVNWPALADLLQQLWRRTSPSRTAADLVALSPGRAYQQVLEGFLGVWCVDSRKPVGFDAWRQAARRADRQYKYFGRAWNWESSVCAIWPGHDSDRYLGPFTKRTANPVLVVGNTSDPATRYQDAVSTSRLLARARLLTVHGWGHTSRFKSSCADNYVGRYLLTGALPRVGTTCPVDVVPFSRPAPAAAAVPPLLEPAAPGRALTAG